MYYLWINDAQSGPFTFQQVQALWNAGQLTVLHLYWTEGNSDWQPLQQLLPQLEPRKRTQLIAPPITPSEPGSAYPALVPEARASSAAAVEQTIWEGHPSFWHWSGTLFWALLLSLLGVGLILFLYVYFVRRSTTYRITNKRVSLQTGLFSQARREIRIQDVRGVATSSNLFGYGRVEFSTAAKADAEIIFHGLRNANAIREMVNGLQR